VGFFFSELRLGTGYAKKAQKRVDAWALNCYPSSLHVKVAYEIKVYRSDFLNELKAPKKRDEAMSLSNQFYFVAPLGVIKLSEVPIECGYMEITEQNKIKVIKEAPFRMCKEPTWLFSSALARRTAKNEGVDFADFTDEVINGLMSALYNIKQLNGSEALLYGYIEKEKFRRANNAYAKKSSEQRARARFYAKCRKENCYIRLDEMQKLWKDKCTIKKVSLQHKAGS
jgi:hypothetical protein